MKKIFLSFLALVIPLSDVFAQELPPELSSEINNVVNNAINGVILFSSQSTISSGNFRKRNNDGSPDSRFEVVKLPFKVDLTDEDDDIVPFLDGTLGYFRLTEQIPPAIGDGQDDFSVVRTLTGVAGGGVKIKPISYFSVIPAFNLAYSKTENFYDYNNPFSQQIVEPFGKQALGWSLETITYIPNLTAQYDVPVGSTTLSVMSKYSHLFNRSISSNSPTIDIDSNTGLWQNTISLLAPLGQCLFEAPISLRPFITRSDIYGAGRKGLELKNFYETGVNVIFDTGKSLKPLSKLAVGLSLSFGENFDQDFSGWRVGLGWEF